MSGVSEQSGSSLVPGSASKPGLSVAAKEFVPATASLNTSVAGASVLGKEASSPATQPISILVSSCDAEGHAAAAAPPNIETSKVSKLRFDAAEFVPPSAVLQLPPLSPSPCPPSPHAGTDPTSTESSITYAESVDDSTAEGDTYDTAADHLESYTVAFTGMDLPYYHDASYGYGMDGWELPATVYSSTYDQPMQYNMELYGYGYYWDRETSNYTYLNQSSCYHTETAYDGLPAASYTDGGLDVSHELDGVCLSTGAAAEILKMWFPHYSNNSLQQLFQEHGCNIMTCFQELTLVEQEAGAALPQRGRKVVQNTPTAPSVAKPFKLEEDAFPALSVATSPAKAANGGAANSSAKQTTTATKLSSQPLSTALAKGSGDTMVDKEADPSLSSTGAIQMTPGDAQEETGTASPSPINQATAGIKPAPLSYAALIKAARSQPQPEPSTARPAAPQIQVSPLMTPAQPVHWVETGDAVAQQYATVREEARDHARLRNLYFQQATLAYLAGNKALAKAHAERGRQHAQAMKSAHMVASRQIFNERNKITPEGFVDLHGLHAKEAASLLAEQIEVAIAAGRNTLTVCIGAGKHTKGVNTPARVPAAVQRLLDEQQRKYKIVKPGLLSVQL